MRIPYLAIHKADKKCPSWGIKTRRGENWKLFVENCLSKILLIYPVAFLAAQNYIVC